MTTERLLSPKPRNWLMYRRTYNGWGYSPLDQITRANVASLEPVWTFSTGSRRDHQSPPIVNDGRMFVTTPLDAGGVQMLALDAATGDLLWRYAHELPADARIHRNKVNRGVALYGDNVYVGTADAQVVALDAVTGEVVWEQPVADPAVGYFITMAPLTVDGKVMVGMSGGGFGTRGFVTALDADTGREVWKTYTVPAPGEPGTTSTTTTTRGTGTRPIPHWCSTSCATVGPSRRSCTRGATATSGSWSAAPPASASSTPSRTFIRMSLPPSTRGQDVRRTTRSASREPPSAPSSARPTTANWPPAVFNPTTGLLYIPANENLCTSMKGHEVKYTPGRQFVGAKLELLIRDDAGHVGERQAWDLDAGERVWRRTFPSHNVGSVLTTAGGLVFMGGTSDRYFRAFDAMSGEEFWRIRTNSGVIGVPTAFAYARLAGIVDGSPTP